MSDIVVLVLLFFEVGDAYVCCSGLPEADEEHAINVANFAIAVQHCSRRVLSPLDGSPIQLRVGIHTGSCASGIVGVTNPRYCVFGDTVNTTARYESTSQPGRINCSITTMIELHRRANADFHLISRGMIEMKGKGELPSYWLEASEQNALVNQKSLEKLDAEVMKNVKGIQPAKPEQLELKKELRSLVNHIGKSECSSDERHTSIAGDVEDSKSCAFSRSSSNSSSTPSRKDLAQMLTRSSAGSNGNSSTRGKQRRSRLQQAKNDISRVLEVVEQAEPIVTAMA